MYECIINDKIFPRVLPTRRVTSLPCLAPALCSTGPATTMTSYCVCASWTPPTAPGLEALRSTNSSPFMSTWGELHIHLHSPKLKVSSSEEIIFWAVFMTLWSLAFLFAEQLVYRPGLERWGVWLSVGDWIGSLDPHMHRELLRPRSNCLVTNLLGTKMLNPDLWPVKSILTYVPFCSRWVSAVWRAVVRASSVDLFPL